MSILVEVERATIAAWRARDCEERDGWVLQADGGVTGRPNACCPLAFTGDDVERALDAAEDWYRARHLPPQFKLCEGAVAPADLADRLAARGYEAYMPTLVMTRALPALVSAPGDVALSPEPTPAFDSVFDEVRTSEEDRAERRGLIARAPQPKAHAVVLCEGRPAAIGMSIITNGYAGLMAMRTPPWARRRGFARQIVDALLVWAHTRGAHTAYLQVEEPNTAAIALYGAAGFTTLSRYLFWRRATA